MIPQNSSVAAHGDSLQAPAASMRHVQHVVRASGEYLSSAVYTTFYCASYGVAFPVVFLSHLIPGCIPLAAGIADGARAARVYVHDIQLSRQRMHHNEESAHESDEVV